VLHFSAAHRLESAALGADENRAVYGACLRDHGHNYQLEVTVKGRAGADGMVMDVALLEDAMRRAVVDQVDHRDLTRDVPGLVGVVTTGENLATVFYRMLEPALPAGVLHRVAVVETANNRFELEDLRDAAPEEPT
jgi:6-pyruvoyltetrahydropterin/6-carboxytetrahydropterin synthase